MSPQDEHPSFLFRFILSLCAAVAVCVTGYVCVWYEFSGYIAAFFPNAHPLGPPSFWQFMTSEDSRGMRITCFLSGLLTLPICFLLSSRTTGQRSLWKAVAACGITALFALGTAVGMSTLHIPSGH